MSLTNPTNSEGIHEGELLRQMALKTKRKVTGFSELVDIGTTALYRYFKAPKIGIAAKEKIAKALGKSIPNYSLNRKVFPLKKT